MSVCLCVCVSVCVCVLYRDGTIRDKLGFIHQGPDAEIDLGSWGILVAVLLGVVKHRNVFGDNVLRRNVPYLLGEDIGRY